MTIIFENTSSDFLMRLQRWLQENEPSVIIKEDKDAENKEKILDGLQNAMQEVKLHLEGKTTLKNAHGWLVQNP